MSRLLFLVTAALPLCCDSADAPAPVVVDITGLRCPEHAFVNWAGACECNNGYAQSKTELECLPQGSTDAGASTRRSGPGGSGQAPPRGCVPACGGLECGDDGCGGVCGTCDAVTESGEQALCYLGRCRFPGVAVCKPYELVDFNACFFGCQFGDTACWDGCQPELDAQSGCDAAYRALAVCAAEHGCLVWLKACVVEACYDELRLVSGGNPGSAVAALCGYADVCGDIDLCAAAGGDVFLTTAEGTYCSAHCQTTADCVTDDMQVACVAVERDGALYGYCLRPLTYQRYEEAP